MKQLSTPAVRRLGAPACEKACSPAVRRLVARAVREVSTPAVRKLVIARWSNFVLKD